jgi:predicted molibdopterin-dependent oxidoreductase YjgC
MATAEIHTYCPMCIAQCGVVAVVEDGRFTKVRPDSEHPNGGICIKGLCRAGDCLFARPATLPDEAHAAQG